MRKAGEKSAAFRLTLAAALSFGLAEAELIRRCRSFYSSYPSGELADILDYIHELDGKK